MPKRFAVQSTLRRKVALSLIFISDLKIEISEVGGIRKARTRFTYGGGERSFGLLVLSFQLVAGIGRLMAFLADPPEAGEGREAVVICGSWFVICDAKKVMNKVIAFKLSAATCSCAVVRSTNRKSRVDS